LRYTLIIFYIYIFKTNKANQNDLAVVGLLYILLLLLLWCNWWYNRFCDATVSRVVGGEIWHYYIRGALLHIYALLYNVCTFIPVCCPHKNTSNNNNNNNNNNMTWHDFGISNKNNPILTLLPRSVWYHKKPSSAILASEIINRGKPPYHCCCNVAAAADPNDINHIFHSCWTAAILFWGGGRV